MPNLLKKTFSKSNPSESSSTADVPANDKGVPQKIAATSGGAVPAYSDSLKEAWAAAQQDLPKADKLLDRIADVQDTLTLSPEQQSVITTLAAPVNALLDSSKIADAIHKGVDSFMDAAPPLMKALGAVAKVHPFIAVVVLAFKAVYTLEKNRRQNDKKVLALYAEMKDMMKVLLQLDGMSDPKQAAPDGTTIEGRMQGLCKDVAKDITKCGNTCDTYLKKKLLVKIFAGSSWGEKLVEFVDIFAKRRREFEFALTIHTAVGVDAAILKVDFLNERTAEISQKMDVMLRLFPKFVTPQQEELAAMVEARGGDAALENEEVMEELIGAEFIRTARSGDQRDGGRPFSLVELQQEIKGNLDDAVKKNADFFDRKFEIQKREIMDDIDRALSRQGDRVISALTAGPHDRIINEDIYNIWKEMGWRGSVKARHFVMALKDYYVEKATGASGSLTGPDSWAIKYINIGRAGSILEAFDDDASGFVTVKEVNDFTQSRPSGWSLPHYVAYWAIGWQMTCTVYCKKIEEIFDAMISLAPDVLPENQRIINERIDWAWTVVTPFVQSIERDEGTNELRSKFESHFTAEEARLQRNLEDINYRIDDSDMLRVIAGEGRIEMTLLPMLYLSLKRELAKISLAQKHVLSVHDLSFRTVHWIVDAAFYRIENLRSVFEQQNLDVKDQFRVVAKGLFDIASEPGYSFYADQLREPTGRVCCGDEIIPDPDSIPLTVLNHPRGKMLEINFAAYDPPEPSDLSMEGGHPVLGVYYGFLYQNGTTEYPMVKFAFSKDERENAFVGSGAHPRQGEYLEYKIAGNWSPPLEDGKIPVELKVTYSDHRLRGWYNEELKGVFDPQENSLRGTRFTPTLELAGEFVLKRDPDFVRFYPAPSVTNARKRWDFATTAVLDRIRRQTWSSKRIFEGIRDRKRFMELALRRRYARDNPPEEWQEAEALFSRLHEADVEFIASLMNFNLSKSVDLLSTCNKCFSSPEGSKVTCMDCSDEGIVELCSEPECMDSTVTFEWTDRKPHLPHHRIFKVYRFIFRRDMVGVVHTAKQVPDYAHGIISKLKRGEDPMPECAHCQTVVSLPCWFCMECRDRFICDSCEQKGLAFDTEHTKMHTLIRVPETISKELSTEERLRLVERELVKIRQILAKEKRQGTQKWAVRDA